MTARAPGTNVVWECLRCGEVGTYDWATITTKTDASLPDAKHAKTCGSTVWTATSESTLAKIAGRVA